MNPRVRALLQNVTAQAQRHIAAEFGRARVQDFAGHIPLRLVGETLPMGAHRNRYELHLCPAISEQQVIARQPPLHFTFVVFTPTGELRDRRDNAERTRTQGQPNHSFVEMCSDLAPFQPAVRHLLGTLVRGLREFWPERTFAHLATVTTSDLDLVAIFVDSASLQNLALAQATTDVVALRKLS